MAAGRAESSHLHPAVPASFFAFQSRKFYLVFRYFSKENFNWVKILKWHKISFMSNYCLDSVGFAYFSQGQLSLFFPIHVTHATEIPPPSTCTVGGLFLLRVKAAYEEDTEQRLGFGKAQTLVSILDFLWDLKHYPLFCTCTRNM